MMREKDKKMLAREAAELGFLLKRHDPVSPPNALELAALENGIWTRIDALPTPATTVPEFPVWLPMPGWSLRGAAMAAVLVMLVGFAAGRHFTETAAVPAESEMMFASAGGMPWHSFLTESQSGDSDDNGE